MGLPHRKRLLLGSCFPTFSSGAHGVATIEPQYAILGDDFPVARAHEISRAIVFVVPCILGTRMAPKMQRLRKTVRCNSVPKPAMTDNVTNMLLNRLRYLRLEYTAVSTNQSNNWELSRKCVADYTGPLRLAWLSRTSRIHGSTG